MEEQSYEILSGLLIAVIAFLYKIISDIVYKLQSKPLFRDALNHGILDKADGKQYRVKKGSYDEYILIDRKTSEHFIMSEKHLWECLRKRKDGYVKKYSHQNSYCIITYSHWDYNPI